MLPIDGNKLSEKDIFLLKAIVSFPKKPILFYIKINEGAQVATMFGSFTLDLTNGYGPYEGWIKPYLDKEKKLADLKTEELNKESTARKEKQNNDEVVATNKIISNDLAQNFTLVKSKIYDANINAQIKAKLINFFDGDYKLLNFTINSEDWEYAKNGYGIVLYRYYRLGVTYKYLNNCFISYNYDAIQDHIDNGQFSKFRISLSEIRKRNDDHYIKCPK